MTTSSLIVVATDVGVCALSLIHVGSPLFAPLHEGTRVGMQTREDSAAERICLAMFMVMK